MALSYDLWHLAFANLIQDRAPPNFEVQSEVRLTIEPQRADMLLLRRIGVENQDHNARILRRLQLWMRETKMKQPDIEDVPGFKELFAKSIAKAIQERSVIPMPADRPLRMNIACPFVCGESGR